MSQVVERTVWKVHYGKDAAARTMLNEFKELVLKLGVSKVEIHSGLAGKDVGNVIMLQYFRSAEDNGRLNDAFAKDPAIKAFMEKRSKMEPETDLVSHDLYVVED